MIEEEVLFEARGVRLTTSAAQIEGKIYPLDRITSVRAVYRSPSLVWPVLFGASGILSLCLAALVVVVSAALGEQGIELGIPMELALAGVAGAVVFLLAAAIAGMRMRGRHFVVIDTEGGDSRRLAAPDPDFAVAVRLALEEALALHSEGMPTALIQP
jgi:hypothetical protein